jgi:hypothetical protein
VFGMPKPLVAVSQMFGTIQCANVIIKTAFTRILPRMEYLYPFQLFLLGWAGLYLGEFILQPKAVIHRQVQGDGL